MFFAFFASATRHTTPRTSWLSGRFHVKLIRVSTKRQTTNRIIINKTHTQVREREDIGSTRIIFFSLAKPTRTRTILFKKKKKTNMQINYLPLSLLNLEQIVDCLKMKCLLKWINWMGLEWGKGCGIEWEREMKSWWQIFFHVRPSW